MTAGEMRSVRLGAIWIILVTLAFSSYANEELENIFDQGYEAFVGRDYAGAADFWIQSGSRGHVRSQNGLGVLYRDGDLGQPDIEESRRWFEKAANRGYSYAMFNLGMLHKNGQLINSDDRQGYKWLFLSGTINFDENANAQLNLLSQRMNQQDIIDAKSEAQSWINAFFYGISSR
jgi:TPR repeat protein